MSSAATAKRFGRPVPAISAASSDASWAPSRRAGRRRSAVTSSSAMIAADTHRLQLLPQPPLPQVPGAGARRMARAATGRTVAGAVLPRRLHPADAGRRDRLPEQGRRLCDPVPRGRRDAYHHRRRSQASGRANRRHRGAPYLGSDPAASSAHSLRGARRRPLARRHALDRLPPRLLPAGARAVAPVPPTVPAEPRRMHSTPASCASSATLPVLPSATAFATGLDQLRRIEWVVYAKPPFGGPEQVLAYLGRYTHRVAIANSRLVSLSDGKVRFAWKDYRQDGKTKVMTLDADEFIRRFLLHALPDGFHRIRHYGFLANGQRGDNLALCRRLLDAHHTMANSESADGHAKDRTTPVTSSSAPSAAAPCAELQPCRVPPPISRSTVTRHDLIAADFRHHHRHRVCCASCRQPASYADRLPQYLPQSWPTTKPDRFLTFSTRSARFSSPKQRFASVARPSSEQSRQHGGFWHAVSARRFVEVPGTDDVGLHDRRERPFDRDAADQTIASLPATIL